jgi:TfoX/Sxy family transcriptional regulator of competence genes
LIGGGPDAEGEKVALIAPVPAARARAALERLARWERAQVARSDYGGQPMSAMQRGSMPRPGAEALAAFDSLVPAAPGVTKRPMFGNRAAFVNGNMFAGLFGDGLFVRLPEAPLQELLGRGGRPFEPMPGRAMKGYAFVPDGWLRDPDSVAPVVADALAFTAGLPPKQK